MATSEDRGYNLEKYKTQIRNKMKPKDGSENKNDQKCNEDNLNSANTKAQPKPVKDIYDGTLIKHFNILLASSILSG